MPAPLQHTPFHTGAQKICARARFAVCAVFVFASAMILRAQSETSATLGGTITGDDFKSVIAGARVTLRHTATGDAFATRANNAGQYLFTGLRPDETYTIRVTAPGHTAWEFSAINLSLGEERRLDIALADPSKNIVQLETLVVTAAREHPQAGAATVFSAGEIEGRPGIEETLNDIASADPRITMIDSENGEIAAAGQNFRYNSIQLDGIRMDDQFGLDTGGLPTLGNPFSMETIQSVSVDLTPYQVSRGGFTGAAINAVSKSGSNDFSGSAHISYRNEKFLAKNPLTGARTPFTDVKYGFVLGGPVARNHLFFLISWERSNHTTPPGDASFEPDAADVARIVAIARDKYGYDAGSLQELAGKSRQTDRYMAKLDWRINSQHRLSARYNGSHGADPVYPATSETSLSSRTHLNKRSLDGWSVQLFSQWHDAFRTEASYTWQTVKARRVHEAPWPDVHINQVAAADGGPAGSLWLGTDAWDQENDLRTVNSQGRLSGTWLAGKHRIEFGYEQVGSRFENTYLRYAWGRYTFASIDAFEAGTPSNVTFQHTDGGEIPTVCWGYAVHSVFAQDTWRPIRSLTLTAGIRLDYPAMSDRPRLNPAFVETFGMRNDGTINGAHTLGPRLSFGWAPARQRQIFVRGGAGLFQGRAPGVWLSNAFTNDGMTAFQDSVSNPSFAFNPDIDHRPPLDPASIEMPVNLISPKLRLPAIIRGNIAADMRLPWQKMIATVEWLWSRSHNSLVYRNINLRQTATGPDGRPIYGTWTVAGNGTPSRAPGSQLEYNTRNGTGYDGPSFAEVYLLTNADRDKDKSQASYLTFMLRRPMQNHWGFNLSYTRGHATDVATITDSTAQANMRRRVSLDPNGDECGTSSTEVRDRILATLTFNFALVRRFNTTAQFVYDGHSGRPYSFSFVNNANGADTTNTGNDLFYVPAGPNDTKIYWASQEDKERFFAYLATNDGLRRFSGRVVSRNSENCPFQHRIDLRLSQQIPLWRGLRGEFVFNIINLTNLLNSKWGEVYQYGAPFAMPVASGYYNPETNQYQYSFSGTPREPGLRTSASRWQLQAGLKVKF